MWQGCKLVDLVSSLKLVNYNFSAFSLLIALLLAATIAGCFVSYGTVPEEDRA